MSEEPVELLRGHTLSSMGNVPRPSPPRTSPTNNTYGQRLRAATSFSPHNSPSSMAIRRTGTMAAVLSMDGSNRGNTSPGKSLAAIAGPMGITVVDATAPQRPWLVLNYSSCPSLESSTANNNDASHVSAGGISTMAFQPCPSSLKQNQSVDDSDSNNIRASNNSYGYSQSTSSPILLATARGSGILIWDCSGRALSPLLGRLNASDSRAGFVGGTKNKKMNNNTTGAANRIPEDATTIDGHSMGSEESGGKQQQTQQSSSLVTGESNLAAAATQDSLKSTLCSPISLERKSSLISVSSSSSLVTSNATNINNNSGNMNPSSVSAAKTTTAASPSSASAINRNYVTSLDWKGPSAPILLSTCGVSACIWDLRTSLFSGLGGGSSAGVAGARPNARFTSPEDGLYHPDAYLIHCAYSHDESAHSFATLDSVGVVRVWDDRKADRPRHSFLACPGGGVGIASIASNKVSESRWVTWGIDDAQTYGDDLVVKVWTRANTASTVSTNADSSEGNDDGCESSQTPYHMTSRITMPGAAAARVHPSFPNGIVLFRDNPPQKQSGITALQQKSSTGLSTPTGFGVVNPGELKEGAEQGLIVEGLKMRTTPELGVVQTPPSPPSLMLEETGRDQEVEETPQIRVHDGWEAELWKIDTEDTPPAETGEAKVEGTIYSNMGARKVTEFQGGGAEEDALSFAPGRGDVSNVIAADLTVVPSVERKEELRLCVLTKAGKLTFYGIPEASDLAQEKDKETTNKRGRVDIMENTMMQQVSSHVYQSSAERKAAASSPWWNKNEEEDLFGDGNATGGESPRKASMESLRSGVTVDGNSKPPLAPQFDMDLPSNSARLSESIAEKASAPSIIPDVDLASSMEDVPENQDVDTSATGDVQNLPIDPAVAARVPCPPLCGAAFSGVGELVTFNNGPVKRMWSYYQSNESLSPSGPNLSFSFKTHMKTGSDVISSATSDDDEDPSVIHNQESTAGQRIQTSSENQTLPRSLADLIQMNLRSQTLQWGDGDNEQPDNNSQSDDGNSSSSSSGGGSSSYEDGELLDLESDESGGISESDDSQGFYHISSNDSPNMFDDYFSTSRKSLLGPEHEDANGAFAGLPSLSPFVAITNKYDDILLNGQTPELAHMLHLGSAWWLNKDFEVPDSSTWQNSEKNTNVLDGTKDKMEFTRNSSDPYLSGMSPETPLARSSSFSPTRPKSSKHTSMMGNLKKLFANQPPTSMTPPDQRLLNTKNRQKSAQVDWSNDIPAQVSKNIEGQSPKLHLGVYMLENPQTPEAASERLAITHKICLHNAQVCSRFGQKTKADTWKLLAQTIQSIFTFEIDETDGWGGDGDALTCGIVEQVLRYYEVQGDFQMLSTIVCVLTFGRDRRRLLSGGGGGRFQLLPKFDERRFDNYIHRYSTLLYGWGILTVRSEVSKRIAYSAPCAREETLKPLEQNTRGDKGGGDALKSILRPLSGVVPNVTFTPLCGICMEPVIEENNICLKCKEYAFQCSICCSAVRGACTWCPLCGHGGHLDHMMQWFEEQKVCPTGCGCICMLENPFPHPQSTYP